MIEKKSKSKTQFTKLKEIVSKIFNMDRKILLINSVFRAGVNQNYFMYNFILANLFK